MQIAGPAGCEPAARAFYGDLLGLRELERPEALRNHGGVWFACGAVQIHIGIDPDFRPARKAHAAFRVLEFDALKVRLRDAGYEIVEDAALPGVQRFFCLDCWGNRLEFIASVA